MGTAGDIGDLLHVSHLYHSKASAEDTTGVGSSQNATSSLTGDTLEVQQAESALHSTSMAILPTLRPTT